MVIDSNAFVKKKMRQFFGYISRLESRVQIKMKFDISISLNFLVIRCKTYS